MRLATRAKEKDLAADHRKSTKSESKRLPRAVKKPIAAFATAHPEVFHHSRGRVPEVSREEA